MTSNTNVNENTYIRVSLVISLIAVVAGGAAWLTRIHELANSALARGEEVTRRLDETDDDQRYYRSRMFDRLNKDSSAVGRIDSRLSRIEGKLDIIQKKLDAK